MQDIFALPIEELQELFVAAGLKKFRAKQVFQWLYQKSVFDFAAMHNLSKADIAVLQEKFTVLPRSLKILREQNSSDGMTSKLLLGLPDGNSVETVLMHHDYGYSVCVSSQVGCDMHCAFCASGLKGAVRNLTAAEIVAQVYLFNERLREQGAMVSRVVVMGSGEPMLNFDSVLQALDFLHREDTCNMSYRNMTLSTCGIITGIKRLEEQGKPVEKPTWCTADFAVPAAIPEKYIPAPEQRMDLYRRMARVRTQEEGDDIIDELIDRYGEPPKSVTNLIAIALLRARAAALGMTELAQKENSVRFSLPKPDFARVAATCGLEKYKGRLLFSAGEKPYLSLRLKKGDDVLKLTNLVLTDFAAAPQ